MKYRNLQNESCEWFKKVEGNMTMMRREMRDGKMTQMKLLDTAKIINDMENTA